MNTASNSQGEHYNLRWNNYFTNLVQVFTELRQKEQMVDVTLVCEDQQIRAHKIILSACSGFFMDLFQSVKEIHPVIIFHEIKYSHLKHIISFLYQGEVKVLDVDLEGVLTLGEKFQVKGLSSVKLKHNVIPTELGAEIAKSQEGKHAIKYELKTLNRSFPKISTPDKNVEKETTKMPKKGRPKVESKKKRSNEPAELPLKKLKVIPSLKVLNTSMIRERFDKHFSSNTDDTQCQNLNINNRSKIQKLNDNVHSIKTNFTVKVEETIDLSAGSNEKINECREKSLTNNSTKNVESSHDITGIIRKKPNEIKKPVNAFILFSKEWRKKLEVEHPNEDFKNISVRLGNLWKTLTSETRESYYMAARQEQLNHQIKNSKTENLSIF